MERTLSRLRPNEGLSSSSSGTRRDGECPEALRDPDEPASDAALRELREEIGMTSHGPVEAACDLEEVVDFKRDTCSLVIVRDVEYRPKRWSWEVEAVRDDPLDQLPPNLAAPARRWLEAVATRL